MASAANTYDGTISPIPSSFAQIVNPATPTGIPGLAAITAAHQVYTAQVTVEGPSGAIIRYRDDGAPTSTVGMPLFAGTSLSLPLKDLSVAQFVMDSATTAATVNIALYGRVQ